MLKIILGSVTLLFLSTSLLIAQQNPIGEWSVDVEKTLEIMSPTERVNYDGLPTIKKEKTVENLRHRKYVFKDHGAVEVSWKSDEGLQNKSGTWMLSGDKKLMSLTFDGQSYQYTCEFQAAQGLVLKSSQDRGIFNNLYLLREKGQY